MEFIVGELPPLYAFLRYDGYVDNPTAAVVAAKCQVYR